MEAFMFRYPYTKLVGFGILTVFTVVSGHAGAQTLPLCSTGLPAPPIYITGSSALEPLMQALGPVLARTSDPATHFSLGYLSHRSFNRLCPVTPVTPAPSP